MISKRDLERIIRKEFDKDTDYSTLNVYSTKKKTFNVNCYGDKLNFDFNIDFEDKSMILTYLNVDEDLRGRGYGRKLVEAGEGVAKYYEIGTGYINSNINKPFWDYMGYKRNIKIYNPKVINVYSLVYNATKSNKIREIIVTPYEDRYEVNIDTNKKTYTIHISKDLKNIEYEDKTNKGLIGKVKRYINEKEERS